MNFTLPEGRAGQISAVGLALLALAALWLGALAPALAWYGTRAATLQNERLQVAHMAALVRDVPALRASVGAAAHSAGATVLLSGGSDEIAGANLQSAVQALAAQSGTSLDSAEMLPAEEVGALRRIGVSVGITTNLPALTGLLAAIDAARPRMVVDDLTISSGAPAGPGQDIGLQAGFTVSAFRSGGQTGDGTDPNANADTNPGGGS